MTALAVLVEETALDVLAARASYPDSPVRIRAVLIVADVDLTRVTEAAEPYADELIVTSFRHVEPGKVYVVPQPYAPMTTAEIGEVAIERGHVLRGALDAELREGRP